MNIKFNYCLLFLLSFTIATAQYTEEINSNRPGFSQGAFSVGKNVLQFEAGFGLGKEKHNIRNTEINAFAIDYGVRYGFWKEELEVSLQGTYQSNSISSPAGDNKLSNFKSNTIGAKYLFYDPYRKKVLEGPNLYNWKAKNTFQWKDLIPAFSIFAGANFDFADNPFTPEPESMISPKIVLSTQNNWIGGWVFVTNIVADRIGTDFPSYGYLLTLTHSFTTHFSVFVENEGIKSDFYSDQLFRVGTAVLINSNFHLDAAVLLNFKDTPSRTYGRIGVSYRFDMHDSDEYIEEKGKAGRDKKKEGKINSKKEKKKKKKKERKDDFEIEDDGGL